jgi:hypothetical protein
MGRRDRSATATYPVTAVSATLKKSFTDLAIFTLTFSQSACCAASVMA